MIERSSHNGISGGTGEYNIHITSKHSRLTPMCNARFILWPPSLSSPIRETSFLTWEENDDGHVEQKGAAYRYQATVRRDVIRTLFLCHVLGWQPPVTKTTKLVSCAKFARSQVIRKIVIMTTSGTTKGDVDNMTALAYTRPCANLLGTY